MTVQPQLRRLSRRQFIRGAGAAAGAAALGGASFGVVRLAAGPDRDRPIRAFRVPTAGTVRRFHSRPDLRPPAVSARGDSVAAGYLFIGPGALGRSQAGPLIVDQDGEPVWFRPLPPYLWEANFSAWSYRGEPVLAWWQGTIAKSGYGEGEGVIVDSSYRELVRIRPAGGLRMDVHELRLTPEGTALFTCNPRTVTRDLTAVGGPREGTVLEPVIQEVDIGTGRLLSEWRGLDHIPVSESYRPFEEPYDYLHINSIDVAPDGNLLVSGRHTWALYKLDRRTGAVIWRLGGKRSDFHLGSGAQFSWQHDARYAGEEMITVFDNGAGPVETESQSRAIALELDISARTARLARTYCHPEPLRSFAMGSVQMLPDGHVQVGWGTEPYLSEFDADGTLIADLRLPRGQRSYRALRLPWQGTPSHRPAVTVDRDGPGDTTVYASWNGATEIAYWQVHAGASGSGLKPVGIALHSGFETAIPLGAADGYVRLNALDGSRRPLASSRTIRL